MHMWLRGSLACGALSFVSYATWRTMDRYNINSAVKPNAIDPSTTISLSNFYLTYNKLLQTHVSNGKVNYYTLSTDPKLDECMIFAKNIGPNSTPNEFNNDNNNILAYYINLYNLFTMYNVIYHSKQQFSLISSVMNVKSPLNIIDGIFSNKARGYGFFITSKFKMDGKNGISLDYLENKLIRTFNDARIHTAINCASNSCPKLQSFGFGFKLLNNNIVINSNILNEQLIDVCKQFVNSQFHVNFNIHHKKLYLSKIFEWYKSDFDEFDDYSNVPDFKINNKNIDDNYTGCLKFIYKYGNEKTREKLLKLIANGEFRVLYNEYDWDLNSQPRPIANHNQENNPTESKL